MSDPAPLDPKLLESIRAGLDRAYEGAAVESFDPAQDRIVVFSDHHKGAGDKADDFRHCEHAYAAALGYYLEAGYGLFILGDGDELWEESPKTVVKRYRDVFALEAQFKDRGGLARFWGNHDDTWASRGQVRRHLKPIFGSLVVREALRMNVARPGGGLATLFFVHGHQGTADSDRWGPVARLVVRHVWRRFQRLTGYSATTPAGDHALRADHDRAMFAWASSKPGLVLFAGHTHRPVFARSTPDPPPTRPIDQLTAELLAATQAGDATAAAAARVELEYARTAERRPDIAVTVSPPCYFNTGCCAFPDGDITGLEIADGEVRLVRWPANLSELPRRDDGTLDLSGSPHVLARETLEKILDAVAGGREDGAGLLEHDVLPADTAIPKATGRFTPTAREPAKDASPTD